jgi:hydrogenase nickel incorporation protein HypA/HybF
MHELSLAQNILEIVEQHVPREQSKSIKSIKLRVGESSGVVPESLEFCFSAITAKTDLNGVLLIIERVPFMISCRKCGKTSKSELGLTMCPECGSFESDAITGTEMQVVEIELNELKLAV